MQPSMADMHADAKAVIAAAAAAAHPHETGGLLLGWWDDGRVVVRHAVEVPDPHATSTSWTRDQQRAQDALDMVLAEYQHPWLGYVGDWHSHPAVGGPSGQDRASIRRASRQYDQPLVLLIYRADGVVEMIAAYKGDQRQAAVLTATPEGQRPA